MPLTVVHVVFLDSDQSGDAHSGASSGHESNASDGEWIYIRIEKFTFYYYRGIEWLQIGA